MFFNTPFIVSGLQVYEADFQKKQRVNVPARSFHSLTFRHSGAISVETEGAALVSRSDTVTYVPAGLPYATEILESGHMTVIHFDVIRRVEDGEPTVFIPRNPLTFHNLFTALADRFAGRSDDYLCLSLLYEILGTMQQEATAAPETQRISEAKRYIDKNFGMSELSVKGLAERAGVSQVYFRREFQRQLGVTPLAYIRSVRMNNAKSFLRTGYYTVTETARKCGFDSLSYFCATFQRFAGTSPGEYLRKYNRR